MGRRVVCRQRRRQQQELEVQCSAVQRSGGYYSRVGRLPHHQVDLDGKLEGRREGCAMGLRADPYRKWSPWNAFRTR